MSSFSKKEINEWLSYEIKPRVAEGRLSELYRTKWHKDSRHEAACRLYGHNSEDWKGVLFRCGMTKKQHKEMLSLQREEVRLGRLKHNKEEVDRWLERKIIPLIKKRRLERLTHHRWRKQSVCSSACSIYASRSNDWKGLLLHLGLPEKDYAQIGRSAIERRMICSIEEQETWMEKEINPLVRKKKWELLVPSRWTKDPRFKSACNRFSGWRRVLERCGMELGDYELIRQTGYDKFRKYTRAEIEEWLSKRIKPLIEQKRFEELTSSRWKTDPHYSTAIQYVLSLPGAWKRMSGGKRNWLNVLLHCGLRREDAYLVGKVRLQKEDVDRWLEEKIVPLINAHKWSELSRSRFRGNGMFHRTCSTYGKYHGDWRSVLMHLGISEEEYQIIVKYSQSESMQKFNKEEIDAWLEQEIKPAIAAGEWHRIHRGSAKKDPHFHSTCFRYGKSSMDWKTVLMHCGLTELQYKMHIRYYRAKQSIRRIDEISWRIKEEAKRMSRLFDTPKVRVASSREGVEMLRQLRALRRRMQTNTNGSRNKIPVPRKILKK